MEWKKQECIIEKLSNDFGLTNTLPEGLSHTYYRDTSPHLANFAAEFPPSFSAANRSVSHTVNSKSERMENPDFNAITNCESSDEHAYTSSTIYRTLNPSACLDQVRRSSGVIQVNPNLVRILSNVGGFQNVTSVKQERIAQNLVPFEICEGDGLSTESINLSEKPSCTVLTVGGLVERKELNFLGQNTKQSQQQVSQKVQQKEINLREKAHDSTQKKNVEKKRCKVMKQVNIIKKVKSTKKMLSKSDLRKPQFGVQIEPKEPSCDPKCRNESTEKLKPFVSLHGDTQNEVTSSKSRKSHSVGTNSLVLTEKISPHTKDSSQLKVTEMQSSHDCRKDSESLNHLYQIPPVVGWHSAKAQTVVASSSCQPGIEAFISPRPLCFSDPLVSNENNAVEGKQKSCVKTHKNVTERPTIASGTVANATLKGAQKLQSLPGVSACGIYNTLHAPSGQTSYYSTHAVNIGTEEVQMCPTVQGCHDQTARISVLTVASADGAHKQHTSSALNKGHENHTSEQGPSLRIVKFPIHHTNSSTGMTQDVTAVDTVKRPIDNSHWSAVSKQMIFPETPYKNMKTSSHTHAFKAVHLAYHSQIIATAVPREEPSSDHSNRLVSNPSMEVNTSSAVKGPQKPSSEVAKLSKGLTIYDCMQTAGLSLCSTTNVTDRLVSNPYLKVNASSAVQVTQKPSSEVVKVSKGPAIYDRLQTAGLSLCSTANLAEKSQVEKLADSCAPCEQKSDHRQILQICSTDKVKVIKKVSRKHTGRHRKVYSLSDDQCSRTFGFPFCVRKKVARKRQKKMQQMSQVSLTEHSEQTKVNLGAQNNHLSPLVMTGETSRQSEAPKSLPDITQTVGKVWEKASMTAERFSPEEAADTLRPAKKKRKKPHVVKHDSIGSDQLNDGFVKHTKIPVAKRRKKLLVKQDSSDSDSEIIVSKEKSKKSKGKKYDSGQEAIALRMPDLKHLKGIKKRKYSRESEQNGDEVGDFRCGYCRTTFYSKNLFKDHSRTHFVTDSFSCPKCERTYSTNSALQKHVLIHRRLENTKKYQFVCGFCDKEFVYEISYKKHVLNHKHNKSLFYCEKCNSGFVNTDELHVHMRAHHTKRYACKICDRLFFFKSNLIEHKKTHEEFDNVSLDHVRSKHGTIPILEAVNTPTTSLAKFVDIDNLAEEALISKSRMKKSENDSQDSDMSQDLAIDFEDELPRSIVDSEVDVVRIDNDNTGKFQNSYSSPGKKRDHNRRFRSLDSDPKNDITSMDISQRFPIRGPRLRDENIAEEIVDVESLPQCDTTMAAEHSRIGKEQETTKGKSSFFCKSNPFCDFLTSGPEDSEIVCSKDPSFKPTKRSISKLSSGTALHGKKKAPSTSKKAPCRRSKSDGKKRLRKSKERQTVSDDSKEDLFLTDKKSAPNFLKGGIQYYVPQVGEKEPHIEIQNGQCVISHFDEIKDVCTVGTEASSSLAECEIDHCTDMNDSTESTFLCELCSDILPSIDLFEKHLRIHIEKNQDALEAQNVMDRLAEKYGAILNCSVEISALDIFRCEICEKTFSNSLVLEKHSKTHQNEQTVGEPSITDEQSRHSKDYDDVVIATKARRSSKRRETKREGKYFRFHSSEMGWFPCEKCNLTFGAQDYLNKHTKVQHSLPSHEKRKSIKSRRKWTIEPTFFCSLCSRSFTGSEKINRHMQKHMDDSFICKVCGQVVLRLMNIRKHLKSCFPDSENEGKTVPEGDPESLGKKKQKFSDVEGSQRKKAKRIENVV